MMGRTEAARQEGGMIRLAGAQGELRTRVLMQRATDRIVVGNKRHDIMKVHTTFD
jgi:hypothetical protein